MISISIIRGRRRRNILPAAIVERLESRELKTTGLTIPTGFTAGTQFANLNDTTKTEAVLTDGSGNTLVAWYKDSGSDCYAITQCPGEEDKAPVAFTAPASEMPGDACTLTSTGGATANVKQAFRADGSGAVLVREWYSGSSLIEVRVEEEFTTIYYASIAYDDNGVPHYGYNNHEPTVTSSGVFLPPPPLTISIGGGTWTTDKDGWPEYVPDPSFFDPPTTLTVPSGDPDEMVTPSAPL